MPIKESSDELNPPVAIPVREIAPPKRLRSIGDYLALAISTCGVGYFPIAPGTMGSLVGVGLYLSLWAGSYRVLEANALVKRITLMHIWTPQMAFMLVVIFLVTMAGIWAATTTEKLLQKKDPLIVVNDEVAGQ